MRPPGITGPEEQDGNENETRMAINRILGELNAERNRLDRAIAAIVGLNSAGHRRVGCPPRAAAIPRRRGRMSVAGRARIAAAQRARWAKAKQAQASKPVRRMSAAITHPTVPKCAERDPAAFLLLRWSPGIRISASSPIVSSVSPRTARPPSRIRPTVIRLSQRASMQPIRRLLRVRAEIPLPRKASRAKPVRLTPWLARPR